MEKRAEIQKLCTLLKWRTWHHLRANDEQRDLGIANLRRMARLYLNGYNAWQLVSERFFNRIGRWIGHGFCYEAAALEMLAWKEYPNSRLVFGEMYFADTETVGEHAWIEFWHNMRWWVIDPTGWGLVFPIKWSEYQKEAAAKRHRIIPYHEFWENPVSQRFYNYLLKPETSYLFGELMLYRPIQDAIMLMEGHAERYDLMADGTQFSVFSTFLLSRNKRPVNQAIVDQFAKSAKCRWPKRRAYLEANREVAAIKNSNSPSK